MPRYKLTLEYDGSFFFGWQRQKETVTVQRALEEAILSLTGKLFQVYGAGRTDQGVHATGQVAHVQTDASVSCDAWRRGLNFYLRNIPVRILEAVEVPETFHARFSATFRRYQYIILNRPSESVLERGRVWWVHRPLCLEAMQAGADYLIGHHDFSSFRSSACQSASAMKTLDQLTIRREGNHVLFDVQSRSFLHNQVRIMVGSLKRVGEGVWPPAKIQEMLLHKERRLAGPTAPPEGLYLREVGYAPLLVNSSVYGQIMGT
jgi:tRNA pseudouridine38-40 synthase